MAKKLTDKTPIEKFEDPWGGTYEVGENAGKEWGKTRGEVERIIKEKVKTMETSIDKKIEGVVVNNAEVEKDANGMVNINIPTVSTDVTNTSNPNAAQAGAVAQELNAQRSQPFGDVRMGDTSPDGTTVALEFYSIDDNENPFAKVDIPAAQEIGEVIMPRVTTELLTSARIKLGDPIAMRWIYDCIRKADGATEVTNIPAQSIVITVKNGQTTIYTETKAQVPSGTTETLQIPSELITSPGTISITVVATAAIDEEMKTSRGSKSVTVITMDLATTFDPASQLALTNGYTGTSGQIAVPYTYTVPTGTTLRIWVDGALHTTETISGTGRNYVYLTASSLSAGRHNVQLIAESSGLLSNAVSVDLLKAGSNADYLGIRLGTGVSQLSEMPMPYEYGSSALPLSVEQFEELQLDIAAWTNGALTSTIEVAVDSFVTQTLSADRTLQALKQRFDTAGIHTMTISNGTAVRTFAVTVNAAAGVTETETVGYRTKLTASGRTNNEENPADWGGVTSFTGVDWRTNGWNRGSDGVDALLLTNGAKAEIDVKPFVQDVTDGDYSIQSRGMTLEMEIMVSQVMERGATVVSCLWDNEGKGYPMGIKVTTEEAGLFFGGVEEITTAEDLVDADGNYIDYEGKPTDTPVPLKITRPHGTAMNIAIDKWVHLAYVVQPVSAGYGLAMLFVNGVLSRANRYTNSLRQNTPAGITIDSDKADVRIRGLRYYRTPLSADEVLSNYIIDRPTAAEIQAAHANNAVGDSNNTTDTDGNIAVNHDTLLSRGRGVLTIIRSTDTISDGAAAGSGTGLSQLFRCTDKKENFKADLVRWEPPLDSGGNPIGEGFEARNVRMRIQGTSSVKYPYKNLRIYLTTQQGDVARSLSIGGVDVTDTAKGYPLRGAGNSVAQSVICAKTDFVDSSLVMNTGGAHLFDNTMRALGLLTPPQEHDARVRQAVDGLPCDIYAATSETGTLTYMGQFVLNNEKSKSGGIFGMEGVSGFNPSCAIALEALTNSSPMTLFQPAGSANSTALAQQLDAEFDNGFEFNHPEDYFWSDPSADIDTKVPGAKAAIKRLYGWIYDCMPAAMRTNPDYGTQAGWSDQSKAKWVSSKFKTEAGQYFDVNHLLTYYLFTDYWASVDQRAKNILWRTWDGLKWWATFYDGDTAMSIRNDAFMVYLYNVTRDTYDSERAKYAFEGHNSWLWCLVLANFENELRTCAANLRNQLSTEVMLNEFNNVMQGNWSERQYNKSGKLKYIDTINYMNYVYTLTGNRELHRTQFLTDRSRLLDARYAAGNYNGDVITFTVVRNASDVPSSLKLTSGDLYYFGYKLNGNWLQGPSRADAGESLTLRFTETLATNDPLMLGGASCISELDFTDMGNQLNGTVGLSLCTMLSKLVMPATKGIANAPLTLGDTSKLEYIDITGQTAVNTGTAGLFDVSRHTRLTTFIAGGTSLTRVILPEGAPLETLVMPASLQTLTLRYLPRLKQERLTLQGTSNITALNFAECPYLSWQDIIAMCPNIDHVRIEGMSGSVRSSILRPFMSGYRGLTADGTEQTYPALIGTVELEDYPDDADELIAFFERCGLTVLLPEYTMIEFDDSVLDDANVSNLDNLTGYKYGTNYQVSGHVERILGRRFRCLAKVTKKPTTQSVNMGNVDTIMNNGDGEVTIYPLHDENSNFYADAEDVKDCTPAKLDSTEGDWMMYEPFFWSKGVNDCLNGKHYSCYSSNGRNQRPKTPDVSVLTLENIQEMGGRTANRKLLVEHPTLAESYSAESGYSVCKVSVEGYKMVRFPTVPGLNLVGSVFADADGNVLESITAPSIGGKFEAGMYLIANVPDGAVELHFTVLDSAEFDKVVLGNGDKVEDMEPDWVANDEHLCGVVGSSVVGTKLRACITGSSTTASMSWQDFHYYSVSRGMQQIDALMHSRIANLFFAKYGRRDSQTQCGGGSHTSSRVTGGTSSRGMKDTIGYDEAVKINPNVTNNLVDGVVHQYAWYKGEDDYGNPSVTQVNNICCLGYEDIYGHKYDMMDNVDMPNTSGNVGKWRIWMPDGSILWVKGMTTNGYITEVAHGKYMLLVPIGSATGSSSTYFCDYYQYSTAAGRVVYRGYNVAVAFGGVSCAGAIYDASSTYAHIGSRLAFRGKIVVAQSVAAYKSAVEVA